MQQAQQVERRFGARMVEAVAVLFIIVLFAALVIPAVRTARRHDEIKRVVAQGRQLWKAIVDANRARGLSEGGSPLWPTNRYSTSTAYFRDFFAGGPYSNAFPSALFAAPGLPEFSGTNIARFAYSNNAWCITMPLPSGVTNGMFFADQTNDFPLLFTCNLSAGRNPFPTLTDVKAMEPEVPPFGDQVAVVVTYLGKAHVIKAKDIGKDAKLSDLFNPAAVTNGFLVPWSPSEGARRR